MILAIGFVKTVFLLWNLEEIKNVHSQLLLNVLLNILASIGQIKVLKKINWKRMQIWKEQIKLPLFTESNSMYAENIEESTKKFLEIVLQDYKNDIKIENQFSFYMLSLND